MTKQQLSDMRVVKYSRRKLIRCYLLTLMSIGSSISCAQTISTSPYSVYGPGMITERNSALNQAMGGTGYGLQHDDMLNYMNPASLISPKAPVTHIFDVGMFTEQNNYMTNSKSESGTAGGLARLNYWFRLKPWWAANIGLSPYSSVSYSIRTQRDLAAGTGRYSYTGSGNTSQLYFASGFSLTKNLSVGFTGYYLFGTLSREESIVSDELTSALILKDKLFTRKFNADVGVQYKIPVGRNALVLGIVFEPGVTLTGTHELGLYNENNDTLTTFTGDHTTYRLPAKFGGGVSYKHKRSLIAIDARYQPWTRADFSGQETQFQDSWKISAGYSYEGSETAENYWRLISLRAGAFMQQYPLRLEDHNLPSWGYSVGAGLPLFAGRSTLQLTYSMENLGTTAANLIRQRTQKLTLDLVIHNLWGGRRKWD
jgi:hypothetical protein